MSKTVLTPLIAAFLLAGCFDTQPDPQAAARINQGHELLDKALDACQTGNQNECANARMLSETLEMQIHPGHENEIAFRYGDQVSCMKFQSELNSSASPVTVQSAPDYWQMYNGVAAQQAEQRQMFELNNMLNQQRMMWGH